MADFYIPFLNIVHTKYADSGLAIYARALLDHYPGIENGTSRYVPDDILTIQVQTTLEILDALKELYPEASISTVGHSLGTWINLQAGSYAFATCSHLHINTLGVEGSSWHSPFFVFLVSDFE